MGQCRSEQKIRVLNRVLPIKDQESSSVLQDTGMLVIENASL